MARKKERESKSALTERNTLIEEEKKLVELKAFVAKRALILKGMISNYICALVRFKCQRNAKEKEDQTSMSRVFFEKIIIFCREKHRLS